MEPLHQWSEGHRGGQDYSRPTPTNPPIYGQGGRRRACTGVSSRRPTLLSPPTPHQRGRVSFRHALKCWDLLPGASLICTRSPDAEPDLLLRRRLRLRGRLSLLFRRRLGSRLFRLRPRSRLLARGPILLESLRGGRCHMTIACLRLRSRLPPSALRRRVFRGRLALCTGELDDECPVRWGKPQQDSSDPTRRPDPTLFCHFAFSWLPVGQNPIALAHGQLKSTS